MEKLSLDFDIEALVADFRNTELTFPPVMVNSHFGGWSILSSDGSYKDGWVFGDVYSSDKLAKDFDAHSVASKAGLLNLDLYSTPTEVCGDYTFRLLLKLEMLGLYPRRARFTLLPPKKTTNLHRDWPANRYGVRLIIPITSNPECVFLLDNEKHHLEVGGAYLVDVSRLHQAINLGSSNRVNFICDVFDTKQYSSRHQMPLDQMDFVEKWDPLKLSKQDLNRI